MAKRLRIRHIVLIAVSWAAYWALFDSDEAEVLSEQEYMAATDVSAEVEEIRYDEVWLATLPLPSVISPDVGCMAEALYFEARGETVIGRLSVGQLILNRVESLHFPDDVCSVVRQGDHNLRGCQFSYACDGKPEDIDEPMAYSNALKLSQYLLSALDIDLVGQSLFYHASSVEPYWADHFVLRASIGNHFFYEDRSRF